QKTGNPCHLGNPAGRTTSPTLSRRSGPPPRLPPAPDRLCRRPTPQRTGRPDLRRHTHTHPTNHGHPHPAGEPGRHQDRPRRTPQPARGPTTRTPTPHLPGVCLHRLGRTGPDPLPRRPPRSTHPLGPTHPHHHPPLQATTAQPPGRRPHTPPAPPSPPPRTPTDADQV